VPFTAFQSSHISKILLYKEDINMNIKMLEDNYLGAYLQIVTKSGNKIKGQIVKSEDQSDMLKLKTDNGMILVNINAIESIS
jgi:hypothetical protein